MNIPARILARKVMFSYVYSVIMQENPYENGTWDTNSLVDKNGITLEESAIEVEPLTQVDDIQEYCMHLVESFFSYKQTPVVDMDYITWIIPHIQNAIKQAPSAIDAFVVRFPFKKMDVNDQAIFILALAEYSALKTPKEILINEMIELAKRYGDAGSQKLINGVLHKYFLQEK